VTADAVEVPVVVQHGDPVPLGHRTDDQVGHPDPTSPAGVGQCRLDLDRALPVLVLGGQVPVGQPTGGPDLPVLLDVRALYSASRSRATQVASSPADSRGTTRSATCRWGTLAAALVSSR
jgi:hypothetical protein